MWEKQRPILFYFSSDFPCYLLENKEFLLSAFLRMLCSFLILKAHLTLFFHSSALQNDKVSSNVGSFFKGKAAWSQSKELHLYPFLFNGDDQRMKQMTLVIEWLFLPIAP